MSSEPNRANGVKLSEKDLVHLMQLLWSYSTKWEMIGLSLGFIRRELNIISGMPKLFVGAPVSRLQELLSQWVQWPTANHPSHPTLGALCTALRSSLVGLGSLAEEVEKEMKQCASGKRNSNSNFLSPSFSFLPSPGIKICCDSIVCVCTCICSICYCVFLGLSRCSCHAEDVHVCN